MNDVADLLKEARKHLAEYRKIKMNTAAGTNCKLVESQANAIADSVERCIAKIDSIVPRTRAKTTRRGTFA